MCVVSRLHRLLAGISRYRTSEVALIAKIMEKMFEKYKGVMDSIISSNDPEKMQAAYRADKWVFSEMSKNNPEMARKWLEKLETTKWHNCLTKEEADEVVAGLVNQDGSRGGKWSFQQFKEAVSSLGGEMSLEPYYNEYALWATANALYSAHAKSVGKRVKPDDIAEYFYETAVERLKDKNRPSFVREHFRV